MKLLRSLSDLPESLRHGAVTIGNFDGVHRGHARIVAELRKRAKEVAGPSVVLTFDPHPVRLLRPQHAPPPLTWTDRKAELLGQLGVDGVIAYPTNAALLQLTPRQFFDEILRQRLDAKAIVEGPNFHFGRKREGNVEMLRELCNEAGVRLQIVEPVGIGGEIVSSSRVRSLVAEGNVQEACRLLTRPYRLRGMVVHGAGRGRTLGFPTANLAAVETLVPAEGIYAGRAWADDKPWPAAISVGPNPTFGEGGLKIEIYLIGYQGSLYERPLEVDFLARLRGVERFDSVEALLVQMDRDVEASLRIAAEHVAEAAEPSTPAND